MNLIRIRDAFKRRLRIAAPIMRACRNRIQL